MSFGRNSPDRGIADAWLAATQRAEERAGARLTGAITDYFIPDDARLDDRMRRAISHELIGIVDTIATGIRRYAARVLAGRGADAAAEALLGGEYDVVRRLDRSELLRDRRLMDELIARARCDLIAGSLPPNPDPQHELSLLPRLADGEDDVVAAAATALLIADNRRRSAMHGGVVTGSDLPADLHHQLVWSIAASIREAAVATGGDDPVMDRAIVEAAQRSLAAHDEGKSAEAAADRLALALDPHPDELGALLVDALADGRLGLFAALLGRAVNVDADGMRAVTIEPEGDRLWLALRAAALDRPVIAHVALALSDADPRRDIDSFAEQLDGILATPVGVARAALAPLTLPRDMRVALDALTGSRGR